MAHTNNWDETTPTNTTNAVDIDDHIRKLRLDARERLAIDHNFASSDDGTDAYGIHKKVTIKDQIASPTLSANQKCIYAKTADYECELRYKDKRAIDTLIFFIGEIKMRLGTTVPTGWMALNGDSIGQTGSGATHTGSNYEDLYKFLWAELDNTSFPITGGRGATSDADWAALKKGTMPDARSRIPICTGQGAGLTNRIVGRIGGAETYNVQHSHGDGSYAAASHNHQVYDPQGAQADDHIYNSGGSAIDLDQTLQNKYSQYCYVEVGKGVSEAKVTTQDWFTNNSGSLNVSGTSSAAGSTAQAVMNPFIVLSMIIRY